MPSYIPDPELNQLVREVNRAVEDRPSSSLDRAEVGEGHPLETLLGEMRKRQASDLLLIAGSPPVFRVDGQLTQIDADRLDGDDLHAMFTRALSPRLREIFDAEGAVDFSLRRGSSRFRVNLHRQRGEWAAAVRALPVPIPTLAALSLPPSLAKLVEPTRGLVLVSGPTGSGKTSTLAALVGVINQTHARHVITIEDPIEYEHQNVKSIIEQIEVGRDAPSFASALRAALRQDPDVILVGEMRDLETVATALTAAETGHLILSTLHTGDVMQAIHRMVDVFPSAQQGQIRQQLALSLNAILTQHLIPRLDGRGVAPAVELLLANQAVRNHIRNEKLQNLATEITLGKRSGMISLDDSLAELARTGTISQEDAQIRMRRERE